MYRNNLSQSLGTINRTFLKDLIRYKHFNTTRAANNYSNKVFINENKTWCKQQKCLLIEKKWARKCKRNSIKKYLKNRFSVNWLKTKARNKILFILDSVCWVSDLAKKSCYKNHCILKYMHLLTNCWNGHTVWYKCSWSVKYEMCKEIYLYFPFLIRFTVTFSFTFLTNTNTCIYSWILTYKIFPKPALPQSMSAVIYKAAVIAEAIESAAGCLEIYMRYNILQ